VEEFGEASGSRVLGCFDAEPYGFRIVDIDQMQYDECWQTSLNPVS